MRKVFTNMYTIWCAFGFLAPLVLFLPLFWMLPTKGKNFRYVSDLQRIWARIAVFSWFLPYRIEYRTKLDPNQVAIYCSNHTSYIDIVMMGLLAKGKFVFLGKEELAKAPVFGYVFTKFHILVKRDNHVNAYQAMLKASEAIDDGKSVIMFPEGGIRTNNPPLMASFKDGAFRVAIEKQVPIVPVSFIFNWRIFPNGINKAYCIRGKAIVHPDRKSVV